MAGIPPDKLLASAAYRMFVGELDEHLLKVLAVLGRGDTLTQQECSSIGASFHTIRGGAGFFALDEIARIARSLEERLMAPDAAATFDRAEISQLISQFKAVSQALPRP